MKKYLVCLFAAIFMAGSLLACAKTGESNSSKDDSKIQIVTTIFPEYDWVMNVLGDNPAGAEVTMIFDNGADLHSYQPSVDDVIKISSCDMFVYVGGESDEWIDDVLKEAENKDMVVINLLDVLGDSAKEEEVVEGMQAEHDHDHEDGDEHDHEDGEEHDHDHEEVEYDEHVWLSVKNAALYTDCIAKKLEEIDSENASVYRANADAYIAKLNDLDKKYSDVVSSSEYDTLVFGDRFPFRYLVDDYELNYYAAFVGCSTEKDASFDTIIFLSDKADELQVPAIMTIEGEDKKIAETIIENSESKNFEILTMDSMQSVTAEDVKSGITYLSIMEDNLSVLKKALSKKNDEALANDIEVTPEVDLTELSKIMVYSEVYNMVYYPDDFIGKTVKMRGLYSVYYDDQTQKFYFGCIIQDATACCAQGIEFELNDEYVFPDDYPEEGEEITVFGTFDTYREGDYRYCTLRDAQLIS